MSNYKNFHLRFLGFGIAILVTVLDQVSKWWIVNLVMKPPAIVEVIPVFNLVLGYNRGVSFGMFGSDSELGRWLLSALAILIISALIIWLLRIEKFRLAVALGLIIGGAVGNVIDRIIIGAVVDFLDFHLAGFHWPAFNVADMGITCGAALLIWDAIFDQNFDNTVD